MAQLRPSNLYLIKNTISAFNSWKRTYRPGISYSGVGTRILQNTIYEGPHQGIKGS